MSVVTSNFKVGLPTNLTAHARLDTAQIDAKSLTSKAIDLSADKPQENIVVSNPELTKLKENAALPNDQDTIRFDKIYELFAHMTEHGDAWGAAMEATQEKVMAHSVLIRDENNRFWADYYQKFSNTPPVAPVKLNEEQVSWITKELKEQGTVINASTEEHFVYFEDKIYTFKPDGSAYVQDQGVPTSEEDRLLGMRRLQELLLDIEENKQGKSLEYWEEIENLSAARADEYFKKAKQISEVIDIKRENLTASQIEPGKSLNVTV
ncbi:hypothetical protein SAMN04488518_11568 [Pseudovibrio ascidiaceicola]|uniref:Uncharacterized protein n=1 Tax=Pseudovibrio ascidiaceicola TaxID=285279 RepID=A0A1I4EIW2_9HYPH|nr:hypothetical protein [Pseudovibrio ascidiaceicola]SFL05209.1 hypothetical protein SAMN04488518_11568 [Pseudovibrio ascidiaceicola]